VPANCPLTPRLAVDWLILPVDPRRPIGEQAPRTGFADEHENTGAEFANGPAHLSTRAGWMTTPWFVRPRAREDARMRLVCFSYAGVGAAMYARWPDLLPADVDLWAVQLPGREGRLREPPRTELRDVAQEIVAAMQGRIESPFVFFGHSMGAVLAFETAHILAARGLALPRHLLLSSRRPPHLPDPAPPLRHLSDAAFIAEIARRYGGSPAQVLESPELLALLLPALRADIAALETHVVAARPPLAIPITAYGGTSDTRTTRDELEAWRAATSAAFRVRMFPGGHFYLADQRAALLADIAGVLSALPTNAPDVARNSHTGVT
jgi:medium-chain acyl-[acyl-carrier-protein] hydrolase